MAKRAGVSEADYATYDTGTTIFTRQQNIEAFTAGTTSDNLNFQANNIADFLVGSGLADSKPPFEGLFDAGTSTRAGGDVDDRHRSHRCGRRDSKASPARAEMDVAATAGPAPLDLLDAGHPRTDPARGTVGH